MAQSTPAIVVRKEGEIATLTRSRKEHRCSICPKYINKGSLYYSIVIGGGGLKTLKFPERIHIECLDSYYYRAGFNNKIKMKIKPIEQKLYPKVVELQEQADYLSQLPESVYRMFERQGISPAVAIRIKRQ